MFKKVINKVTAFSNFLGNDCYLNIANIDDLSVSKKVVFYTLAWGDYIDNYFSYTLPSLLHESNIPNLVDRGYEISFRLYTIEKSEEIQLKFKRQIKSIDQYKFDIVSFKKESDKASIIANQSTIEVLKHAIAKNLIIFMAVPDAVFSNYSVYNSVVYSYFKRRNFAAAHPRVNENFIRKYKKFPKDGFESNELVSYAMRNLHSSFKFAEENLTFNTCYSGFSFRRLSKSIFAITSNMPSTFVVIPNKEDVKFFETAGSFNEWDRGWLSFLLRKNRIKISGSSDMFFCIEITKETEDTKVKPKKVKFPWRDLTSKVFSNRVSNTFASIWRI